MHEPKLSVTKLTNSIRFRHPCKDCGYPHAAFGVGVDLRGFMHAVSTTKAVLVEKLGIWTCGLNECVNKGAIDAGIT